MGLQNKEMARVGLESTYGTEASSLDTALIVGDVNFNPSAAARAQRGINRPRGGNNAYLTGFKHATLSLTTELNAPLVNTDPAPYDILAQACAMAVSNPDTGVTRYSPILLNDKSMSALVYKNGNLHKMLGARGAMSFQAQVGQAPTLAMNFSGRNGGYATEALPATVATSGKEQAVRDDQVTVTLDGTDVCLISASGDWGTQVAHDESGCNEWVTTDHMPTVQLTIKMPDFATKNWLLSMENQTIGAFDLIWGAAGFKTNIVAPKVSIGQITYGRNGAGHTMIIPLSCLDDQGNDSLYIDTGNIT